MTIKDKFEKTLDKLADDYIKWTLSRPKNVDELIEALNYNTTTEDRAKATRPSDYTGTTTITIDKVNMNGDTVKHDVTVKFYLQPHLSSYSPEASIADIEHIKLTDEDLIEIANQFEKRLLN